MSLLSSLPLELFHLIIDFCPVESALNFSLSSRTIYYEIYMNHPKLFSTRIQRTIFYELHRNDLLSRAKYKRDLEVKDERKLKKKKIVEKEIRKDDENLLKQFNEISNYVKKKKEFIESQEKANSELFPKWNRFLNETNLDETKQKIIQDEIFSKFVLLRNEKIVTGDYRGNYYLSGKIGDTDINFEAYDESDVESTQWSISLGDGLLASFSRDECSLSKENSKKFLNKIKLKINPVTLVEILLQLQPWFFGIYYEDFKLNVIIE